MSGRFDFQGVGVTTFVIHMVEKGGFVSTKVVSSGFRAGMDGW